MDRVFGNHERPFEEIRGVGIAIGSIDDDQRHIGLLHRENESGPVLMLDVQWHHRLRNESPDVGFLWIDPAAHSKRLAQVSDVCRLIWRANQREGIPYGFGPPTDCFDTQTGEWLLGPTGFGLTCATFVLAVFHRSGLPLAVYQSWPVDRPGDREWQEKIVGLLERTGADTDHVEALRRDVGSVRFRPEDVAGAATASPFPVSFADASDCARQILEKLPNP